MNAKLKQLIDIIEQHFYPLTKNHAVRVHYFVNTECTIVINDRYVSLSKNQFSTNHLEIHCTCAGESLVTFYADYNFSDLDSTIIDVVNLLEKGINKESMREKLIKQKNEIEEKLKNLENEN